MWNQPEHLEAYYAVPLMGAVVHTLNPRLHPDELGFIAGDAEDRALIVDESLLGVLDCLPGRSRVRARDRRLALGQDTGRHRSTTSR